MNELTAPAVADALRSRGVEVTEAQAQQIIDDRGAIMLVSEALKEAWAMRLFLTSVSHAAPDQVAAAWAATFSLSNGHGLVPPPGHNADDYLQACLDAFDEVRGPIDPVADFNGMIAGAAVQVWQGQQVASSVSVAADAMAVLSSVADGMDTLASGLTAATGSGWSDSLSQGATSIRSVQIVDDDLPSFVAMVAPKLDQAYARMASVQQAAISFTDVPADNDPALAAMCQAVLDVVPPVLDLPSHRLLPPGE